MELSSFHRKRYAQWAGNERGVAADPTRCCAEVHHDWRNYQCSKPRGHGPEEAYCKIHDPAFIAIKRAEQDRIYEEKTRKWKIERAGPVLLAAMQKIADGHNDAMGLAQETLTNLNLWNFEKIDGKETPTEY